MAVVEFSPQPLPEAVLEDHTAVREQFMRMMKLDIPGFVLNQVDCHLTIVGNTLYKMLQPEIELGFVRPTLFDKPSSEYVDWFLHCDVNEHPGQDRRQINLHWTAAPGIVKATLLPFQPSVMQRVAEIERLGPSLILNEATERFAAGQVDDEVLVPTGYEALLDSSKVLVFADALCAHKFESVTWPRKSTSDMYRALYPLIDDPRQRHY